MFQTISVENFSDGDVITYPLALIKGSVTNSNGLTINSIVCEAIGGKFKHLIALAIGENRIEFTSGSSHLQINLIYKPRVSALALQPLYVICEGHDGDFQAPDDENNSPHSAISRINVGCNLLQSILAEKLYESNYGRKTIMMETCAIFKSKLTCDEVKRMKEEEIWAELGREILSSSFGKQDGKYLAFLSCTRYHGNKYRAEDMKLHEDFLRITEAYVALGGGGLAIFGTACLYTWPENPLEILPRFKDSKPVDRHRFLDDSAYRGTLGACFSSTLGSALHELCHTFDLGHTEVGIMSRGFDNLHKIFLQIEDNPKDSTHLAKSCDQVVSIKLKEAESRAFIRKADFSKDVINKPVYFDDTCFTKSSACILAYHKWFNDYRGDGKYVLSYDNAMRLVKSTLGIRVVEVRSAQNGYVTANWCFPGKILKYSFQLDQNNFDPGASLFVQDNNGNILKSPL